MAINPVNKPKKNKGGLFGKVAGLVGDVGGLALAPFTGGTSIGVGQTVKGVGQAVGSVADPNKQSTQSGPTPLESMKRNPDVQEAILVDALKAADTLPKPQREEVLGSLTPALDEIKLRRR